MGNIKGLITNKNHSSSKQTNNSISEAPSLHVRLQMQLIIIHWFKHCCINSQMEIPMDIIDIIIDKYSFQKIYQQQHVYKIRNKYAFNAMQPKYNYESDQYDYLIRIALTGDLEVGKSSLTQRFKTNTFNPADLSNSIIDFAIWTTNIDGMVFRLHIIDLPSTQRFQRPYFRSSHAIIMIYSIIDKHSFNSIKIFTDMANEECYKFIPKLLIGNKLDLKKQREVEKEDGEKLCEELNINNFIETSAKTGQNTDDALEYLVRYVMNSKNPWMM